MTALTSRPGPSSLQPIPGINHRCFRRKSVRTYELLDPANPGHVLSYDVGQVKEIVEMDRCLREVGVVTSVPAGFREFATRFNLYAVGPERFATFTVNNHGRVDIQSNGSPIVWEHFMIDDWLVGWDRDHVDQWPSGSSFVVPSAAQVHQDIPASLDLLENIGDPKLKALSTRMKVAMQTTDELTKFWIKRGAIEHQYASRLANLAETMIGESDSKELRRAIDAVRVETAQQAMRRHDLATRIAVDLEKRSVEFQIKQRAHWQDYYEPSARKLHDDQVRGSRRRSVASEWKQEYKKLRYSLDSRRLQSLKPDPHFARGGHAGIPEIDSISETSLDSPKGMPGLAKSWEELCDSCWQLEKDRCYTMEESLAVFIDTLSLIMDTDRRSVNTIRQWKDTFTPQDFIDEFCQKFRTLQSNATPANVAHLQPSSSSSRNFIPTHRPAVSFDQGSIIPPSSHRQSLEAQRPRESDINRTDSSRSPTPRERSRHSIGGSLGIGGASFGPRALNRSHSQRQAVLLPLSSEPPSASQSRPTLSKIASVFQRNGSNNRSDRDGHLSDRPSY